MHYPPRSLIAIMGPTASGKSALALELARRFSGELISADSAQVYRGADIGTAKPTPAELAEIPHHLVNIRDLQEDFSLADFQSLAMEKAQDIWSRNKLPIVVGGTGLYVRGFIEGYTLVEVPPDPQLRATLAARSPESLFAQLQELDPISAERIDPRNVRRVARALEVTLQTGHPFSESSRRQPPEMRSLKLAVRVPRELLMERIDQRLLRMVEQGWLEEVEGLHAKGVGVDLRRLRILGYPELLDVIENNTPLEAALEEIRICTRRFAKRQCTWLRAEPNVCWLDFGAGMLEQAEESIKQFLELEKKIQ